jgi:hypothetical protein
MVMDDSPFLIAFIMIAVIAAFALFALAAYDMVWGLPSF